MPTPLAAAASALQPPSSAAASGPAARDASAYQSLSLLILLHECTRRAYGRPLLEESKDLLTLDSQLDELPCCVVLLAPPPPPPPAAPGRARRAAPVPPVPTAAAPGTSPGPSPDALAPLPGTSAPVSGGGTGGGGGGGGGGGSGGGGGVLRVQYLNRAAAEALKAQPPGAAAGGGWGSPAAPPGGAVRRTLDWPLWADEEGGAALMRELMATLGAPQRGQLHKLTLRTGSALGANVASGGGTVCGSGSGTSDGSGNGAGSSGSSGDAGAVPGTGFITCPEGLVLALSSPNGTCAGAALLFDRWEVHADAVAAAGGARSSDTGARPPLLEGRPLVPEVPPGSQPCAEEALTRMQERVRAQADAVRSLKSQQGLANQDPQVVAAVAMLQRFKAELSLQQRLQGAFSSEAGVVRRLVAGEEAAVSCGGEAA